MNRDKPCLIASTGATMNQSTPSHKWPRIVMLAIVAGVAGAWTTATPVKAIEFSGFARAWVGLLETNDGASDQNQLDQRYSLDLRHSISPWLEIFAGYQFNSFQSSLDSQTDLSQTDFRRSSSQPSIGLSYDRQNFRARLLAYDRAVRSTFESQNLNIRDFSGNLDWRATPELKVLLQARAGQNVSDSAVFGRDTEAQDLTFTILYEETKWSARYAYNIFRTQNNLNGIDLDDSSHEARGTYSNQWWQNRLRFSADGRVNYLQRKQDGLSDRPINQPVPLQQGLFFINPTPEIGELTPVPGLIDGDFQTPVTPRIEIGGANTFRNVGVDLGVTRPITQLEITVDQPSSPGLVWQVWQSSDNLQWTQVQGSQVFWEGSFLRYTVQFPETTNRFFKAVNLSANLAADVAVTEIRALVWSIESGDSEGSGTEYWLNLFSSIEPHRRLLLRLMAGTRRDLSLTAGRGGRARDTNEIRGGGRLLLSRTSQLRLNLGWTQFRENVAPVLEREEQRASLNYDWRPLPSVYVVASGLHREETESGDLIRSSDSVRLRANLELLSGLSTSASVTFSIIDDVLSGFKQDTQQARLSVNALPLEIWSLEGSVSHTIYDSRGATELESRTSANIHTSLRPAPAVMLSGNWILGWSNLQTSISQRYAAIWTPGRKLSVTTSYFDTRSGESSRSDNAQVSANYKLNRWIEMWTSASLAGSELAQSERVETTIYRFGLRVRF